MAGDSRQTDGSSCGIFTGMGLYLYVKNGSGIWPTNAALNTSDIVSAREFMMYTIFSSKRTQLESEVLISDSQSCIDEVEAYLRSEQKKELSYPEEDPLVMD